MEGNTIANPLKKALCKWKDRKGKMYKWQTIQGVNYLKAK